MKLLELARRLKPQYVPDWYHEMVADHLDRLSAGDASVPNLLISTPPGSGKTELVSILFPANVFALNRAAHVIALANSDNLARMASLHRGGRHHDTHGSVAVSHRGGRRAV